MPGPQAGGFCTALCLRSRRSAHLGHIYHHCSAYVRPDVAAVDWLFFEEGQLQLLADVAAALTLYSSGGRESIGELFWHAMTTGR